MDVLHLHEARELSHGLSVERIASSVSKQPKFVAFAELTMMGGGRGWYENEGQDGKSDNAAVAAGAYLPNANPFHVSSPTILHDSILVTSSL
jgi:hypothetical protein